MEKTNSINKKSLLIGTLCYLLWGSLPLYWHLLEGHNALFILCNRIVFSALFMSLLMLCLGRFRDVKRCFMDWSRMKYLLPAAVVITVNWGLYIWAVNSGRVLGASLGYYMNPLVVFALGTLIFKDKSGPLSWVALGLAAVGVVLAAVLFGAFPYVALALALSFAVYGLIKKLAHVDALTSITVETCIIAPFALAYLIFAPASRVELAALTLPTALLLVGTGVVTAMPLVLYTRGVNDLPFIAMGFLQFISPTLQFIIGLSVYREPFEPAEIIAFAFIWAGLAVYLFGLLRHKKPTTPHCRRLRAAAINRRLFDGFIRHQVVTRCLRRVDGVWVVRDVAFIDDWTEAEYAVLADCLQATAKAGGFVCGAFMQGRLKGFAAVEPARFGTDGAYLDLSSLHVSEDARGRGIGRMLFGRAAAWAGAQGAQKLYISAHSAVETQAFYTALGCVDAAEPSEAHSLREPCDRQMEYVIQK